MNKTKRIVLPLVILLALVAVVVTPVEAENSKIGYVNMQEVAGAHPAVAQAQQDLQQQAAQLQQEYQAQAEELQEAGDQQGLQQLQQQMQQQFQQLQMQQEDALEQEVMPDIDSAREELGYDIILSREVVVSGGEDITEQVIQYFRDSDDIEDLPEGNNVMDQLP